MYFNFFELELKVSVDMNGLFNIFRKYIWDSYDSSCNWIDGFRDLSGDCRL